MSDTNTIGVIDDEPRLPQDLERLVFETAARSWLPEETVGLLLVAKRVYNWTRPFIYRILTHYHNWPDAKDPRYSGLATIYDTGRYAKHFLVASGSRAAIDIIFSSCPNVSNLALWNAKLKDHLHVMRDLRLTRLSADLEYLTPAELLEPTFINITHLDMDWVNRKRDWDGFAQLPKLSHLSIRIGFSVAENIREGLKHCKSLKLLICWEYSHWGHDKKGLERILDDRVVLMEWDDEKMPREQDWREGALGYVDYWMSAELFAFARKKNFFCGPAPRWITNTLDWPTELNEDGEAWFSTTAI